MLTDLQILTRFVICKLKKQQQIYFRRKEFVLNVQSKIYFFTINKLKVELLDNVCYLWHAKSAFNPHKMHVLGLFVK